ncbi:MAG: cytochrome c oxidase subunit II [Gemmatimonadaceae bacterium]|nr:cytochrome c oxidase subunit II [Gemmatimonadaceae bacterium]
MTRRSLHPSWREAAMGGASVALAGCATAPSVLRPESAPQHTLATLGWWLIIVGSAVIVIVLAIELVTLRHRGRTVADTPLVASPGSTRGIVVGLAITAVVTLAFFIYSAVVLGATERPRGRPGAKIEIIGHQWWWEARYLGGTPDQAVATANELHIPIGVPVALQVTSADVIHSFWIPQLQGKIDVIPGIRNTFWIRADTAGTFHGQCAEFCGLQHAHMMLTVTAEDARSFQRWLAAQSAPAAAAPPSDTAAAAGGRAFMSSACALCHTVRGTGAHGILGPDLTHVASRHMLGAGAVRNTPGALNAWITDAPSLKPGADMPRIDLTPATMHAIVAYLQTLR